MNGPDYKPSPAPFQVWKTKLGTAVMLVSFLQEGIDAVVLDPAPNRRCLCNYADFENWTYSYTVSF